MLLVAMRIDATNLEKCLTSTVRVEDTHSHNLAIPLPDVEITVVCPRGHAKNIYSQALHSSQTLSSTQSPVRKEADSNAEIVTH